MCVIEGMGFLDWRRRTRRNGSGNVRVAASRRVSLATKFAKIMDRMDVLPDCRFPISNTFSRLCCLCMIVAESTVFEKDDMVIRRSVERTGSVPQRKRAEPPPRPDLLFVVFLLLERRYVESWTGGMHHTSS